MANWVIRGAALLDPVYDRLHQLLVAGDVLHADETVLQVLNEPGRKATTDSRMWVYCSGRDGPDGRPASPIILYDYQTTRGAEHPISFLKDFNGFVHVDGYVAYEKRARCDPGRLLGACAAQVRRGPQVLAADLTCRQGPGRHIFGRHTGCVTEGTGLLQQALQGGTRAARGHARRALRRSARAKRADYK